MTWTEALMGQKVTITKRLLRTSGSIGGGSVRVSWYSMGCNFTGMVIGRRWLSNGDILGPHDSGTRQFVRTGTVPCVAVVRNSRENPIYVPFDGFELNE